MDENTPHPSARPPRVDAARLGVVAAVGAALWLVPSPDGVEPRAWQLLAVFVATIVGIILRPLPMGAMAFVAVAFAVMSGTLTIAEATAGFGATVVWLVVAAFFIATAFVKTGLGARIAYHFLRALGKRSLGLAYGIVATDLVLSPFIPSNTARGGGVIYPILKSLCVSLGSDAADGTQGRVAGFLTYTAYQGVVVTSAMFLTAMAANPLAAELAAPAGSNHHLGGLGGRGAGPGPAEPAAGAAADLPPVSPRGHAHPRGAGVRGGAAARDGPDDAGRAGPGGGLRLPAELLDRGGRARHQRHRHRDGRRGAMLATGALAWQDILEERNGWDTLIWFAVLVMMASQLGELGLVGWFTDRVSGVLGEGHWLPAFLGLSLIYFYVHYFFASNTAHVSAMYAPFLAVALAVGTPPVLAALVLAFFSNLFASMTHYGTAAAPILFGSGNVDIGTWWRLGALISVVNIAIWLGAGSLWWRLLGLW